MTRTVISARTVNSAIDAAEKMFQLCHSNPGGIPVPTRVQVRYYKTVAIGTLEYVRPIYNGTGDSMFTVKFETPIDIRITGKETVADPRSMVIITGSNIFTGDASIVKTEE